MTVESLLVALEPLTQDERRLLLRRARSVLLAAFGDEDCAPPPVLTSALREPTAAFVSLHSGGVLRGCVGTVTPERPLHEAVAHLARSAAFDDPRFAPLTVVELAQTDIEISRLSRLVPAQPEDVLAGLHGVCVSAAGHRAVFLPQVATSYQWDRYTLLDELCLKAQLPARAWREQGCTLMVFVAEVFGEGRDR